VRVESARFAGRFSLLQLAETASICGGSGREPLVAAAAEFTPENNVELAFELDGLVVGGLNQASQTGSLRRACCDPGANGSARRDRRPSNNCEPGQAFAHLVSARSPHRSHRTVVDFGRA
jgi:hypothetical protein